jgi:hypothetical protein
MYAVNNMDYRFFFKFFFATKFSLQIKIIFCPNTIKFNFLLYNYMFRPILDHPQFQNLYLKHNEKKIYILCQ